MAKTSVGRDGFDEDFFTIDMDRLFEKWSTFARDYYRKALELVNARAEWERTKRVRDVVEAELDRNIRLNPGDYGVPTPVRESSIEKAILVHTKYQEANLATANAKHAMDVFQSFVDAMDVLKKGLEVVAYLQQSSFHAEPKARGDSYQKVTEAKTARAFGRGWNPSTEG